MRNEISRASFLEFDFKDVCSEFGHKDVLFVDSISTSTIDCMKVKINASDFCQKKLSDDPLYLRGYVDLKKRKVLCQKGYRVLLSLTCEDDHLYYCKKSSQYGCQQLQNIFAKNLELVHSSIILNGDIHHLNCYFSQKEDLTK